MLRESYIVGIVAIVFTFAIVIISIESSSAKITIHIHKQYLDTDNTTLRFHLIGDFGELYPNEYFPVLPCKKVALVMSDYARKSPISMVLSTGDNFYTNKEKSIYETVYEVVEEIFEYPSIHNVPWYLSYGNHDLYINKALGKEIEKRHPHIHFPKTPWNMTVNMTEYSISFTFIPCDIICHGSFNNYVLKNQCRKMKSQNDSTKDYLWLERHLADLNSDPKILWKIVVLHYPIFSVSVTGLDSENLKLYLLPLLHKYNVDLILSGHNHNMQYFTSKKERSGYIKQKENLKCLNESKIKCLGKYLVCKNRSFKCFYSDQTCEDKICRDDSGGMVLENLKIYKKGEFLHQVVQGGGGADLDPMCPLMESPMANYEFGVSDHGFSEITVSKEQINIKFILANDSLVMFESIIQNIK